MPDQEQPPQLPLPGSGDGGSRNILPTNIEDEMKRSYLDYAMSVIVGRALPDIRDGLKPVHRRILYGMQQMGLQPNRPTRKCAKIVGEVMGKYHPHGDAADLRRLGPHGAALHACAIRWSMARGTSARSMATRPRPTRYTEARLSRIATALLEDIDKETVDFSPNYDDSEVEPEVLPTRVPNLLVNGSSGIAVGMATNIPPHNLTEIVDATIQLIQHPEHAAREDSRDGARPRFPHRRLHPRPPGHSATPTPRAAAS